MCSHSEPDTRPAIFRDRPDLRNIVPFQPAPRHGEHAAVQQPCPEKFHKQGCLLLKEFFSGALGRLQLDHRE
eukprot:9478878-Lingulodinium_polyedra.AAC.1